jgi:hypothetical protein
MLISAARLVCAAAAAAAQEPPLKRGDEVRLVAPGAVGEYTFERLGPEAIVVRDSAGSEIEVPLGDVYDLEVLRRSSGDGPVIGAGIGLVAGGALGFLIGYAAADSDGGGLAELGAAYTKLGYGLVGGVAGLVAGVVIGDKMSRDRWVEVQLPRGGRIRPGARGAIVVGHAIRF